MSKKFRDYSIDENVKALYKKLRTNQTLDYVHYAHKKYCNFSKNIKIWDALNALNEYIDVSDPDINLPNIHHLFQTAEAIRKDGHPDWFQLVGLIHDLGKILYLKGNDNDGTTIKEQWGIVGDTFIVGCKIPESVVYPEFNHFNKDTLNPLYNSKLGIYKEGCGLDNCICSFGHDEYLYRVLKFNKYRKMVKLPDIALSIIRYHSLYPWHKEGEYKYFMNKKDEETLKWVRTFNKYDLYTKNDEEINIEELKKYYDKLISKYFPSKYLVW